MLLDYVMQDTQLSKRSVSGWISHDKACSLSTLQLKVCFQHV